ncbi:hypothetical protein EBZ39_11605 [bacterium]|nr:hypothetical protein [bacterium]
MSTLTAKVAVDGSAFETGLARLQNSASRFKNELMAGLAGAFGLERLAAGFENETLAKAMQFMEISAQKAFNGTGDEAAKLREEFGKIGISGNDLVKMTPTEKMLRFAQALHEGALAGQDFAMARELMSRAGPGMLTFLQQGAENIREEADSMRAFASETAGVLKGVEDEFLRIKNLFSNTFGEIGAAILPPILRVFAQIRGAAYEMGQQIYEAIHGNFKALGFQQIFNAAVDAGTEFDKSMSIAAKVAGRVMPPEDGSVPVVKTKDKMEILADSLQKVGGGGRFAQIGGSDYTKDIYGGLASGKFRVKAEIVDGISGFGATQGAQ